MLWKLCLLLCALFSSFSVAQATPPKVIHINDGNIDTQTFEYFLIKHALGEIELLGVIADNGVGYGNWGVNKCPHADHVWRAGEKQYEQIAGKARRSGVKRVIENERIVAGANCALHPPASLNINSPTESDIRNTSLLGGEGVPGSQFIVDMVKQNPHDTIYIVMGGAFTSLAEAYIRDPSIRERIVAFNFGSTNSVFSYNSLIDGWAAFIVSSRFKYYNYAFASTFSAVPVVPKILLRGDGAFPESEIKRFMFDKELQSAHIPTDKMNPIYGGYDADGGPAMVFVDLVENISYIAGIKRASFYSFSYINDAKSRYANSFPYRTNLKDDPNGNVFTVYAVNKGKGTKEWWRVVENINAYYRGKIVQQAPYWGIPFAIPGTIEAEEFDWGGKGYAWMETWVNPGYTYTTGWPLYRIDATLHNSKYNYKGNIEECSEGGYNLSWLNPGDWYEYTINSFSDRSYDIVFRVASNYNINGRLIISSDSERKVLAVPNTGGPQKWRDISIKDFRFAKGRQVIRLEVVLGCFNLNKFQIKD